MALNESDGIAPYKILLKWRQKYGNVFTFWMGEAPVVNVAEYQIIYDTFVRDADSYTGRVVFEGLTKLFRG